MRRGGSMSNDQGEAIFHAAKLLQLYDETGSVEAVRQVAAALLAKRPTDHVRQVAWFLPPELIRVLPKQHRARIVPLQPGLGSSLTAHGTARAPTTAEGPEKAAASLPR
jgi:hypothetical protein